MEDGVRHRGDVYIELHDADGRLIHAEYLRNLVVQSGLEFIAARMAEANPPARMSHMALGSDGGSGNSSQLQLRQEKGRVALTMSRLAGVTTFAAVFGPGVGSGTVAELGIFNSGTAGQGTMLARVVFAPQPKEETTTPSVSWSITQQPF
jgi:hypothetical protein